jgi:hypothetical protein
MDQESFRDAEKTIGGRDLLRMTKMNWNTTLYYKGEPCTFTNAIEVIGMMKELRESESMRPGIRYYI